MNFNQIQIQIQHRKIPPLGGAWGADIAALPLNCNIIEGRVPIGIGFENRRLFTTLQKWIRGSLDKYFDLVYTIQTETQKV